MSEHRWQRLLALTVAAPYCDKLRPLCADTPSELDWPDKKLFCIGGSILRKEKDVEEIEFIFCPMNELIGCTEEIKQMVRDGKLLLCDSVFLDARTKIPIKFTSVARNNWTKALQNSMSPTQCFK